MGTLAYDPDRLRAVVSALGAAHDHLAAISSSDPLANGPVWKARSAAEGLAGWRERIGSLLALDPLGTYAPVTMAATDITTALHCMLQTLYGWQNATDPTGTAWDVPPAMEGAAVGWLLSNSRAFDLLGGGEDPAKEAAFVEALRQVVTDPEALCVLRAYLSEQGIAELAEVLAQHRTDIVNRAGGDGVLGEPIGEDVQVRLAVIDQGFAALAAMIVDPNAPLQSAQRALDGVRPYAAAHVIANMQTSDEVIAELALATLGRYSDSWNDPDSEPLTWELPGEHHVGIGDLLFPKISAGSVGAAREFVIDVLATNPWFLTNTVAIHDNTIALVAHATDAEHTSVGEAADVIKPYLAFVRDGTDQPELPGSFSTQYTWVEPIRGSLGALVAPWLMQFTARPEDWGWEDGECEDTDVGREWLAWIVEDNEALEDLAERAAVWAHGLPIVDPRDEEAFDLQLADIGDMFGELMLTITDQLLVNAANSIAVFNFFVDLIPTSAKFALKGTPLPPPVQRLIVSIVDSVASWVGKEAQENAWFGAPPTMEKATHDVKAYKERIYATAAYSALLVKMAAMIADGTLDPETPPPTPPEDDITREALNVYLQGEWRTNIPDYETFQELTAVVDKIGSWAAASEACADLGR